MMLAHHRCQPPLELPEKIAEPAVAIAFRMSVPIFLPQDHQIDAGALEFARQRHPVRLGAPPLARLETGLGEEPVFENAVGELRRERPADPGLFRPFEIILDRTARQPKRAPDLAGAHPVMMQPKHLSYLSHGQLSLRRHSAPPRCQMRSSRMPELLTRGDWVLEPADMAGFKSEWWPVSFRNGGRHQIVTAAGFASEKVAGINRNSQPLH